jgi:hypothetical protein
MKAMFQRQQSSYIKKRQVQNLILLGRTLWQATPKTNQTLGSKKSSDSDTQLHTESSPKFPKDGQTVDVVLTVYRLVAWQATATFDHGLPPSPRGRSTATSISRAATAEASRVVLRDCPARKNQIANNGSLATWAVKSAQILSQNLKP